MATHNDIRVNGITITSEQVNEELQYHPASNIIEARYEATKALVIRELLLQQAAGMGLAAKEEALKRPDEIIDVLLNEEIKVPTPDKETCEHYYQQNKHKFCTSALFEVAHILYLAPPENADKFAEAKAKAEAALERIKVNPTLFADIAREESACSSATEGGHIGQISKGQTLPSFEAALFKMAAGEISQAPVATEVGYHIIYVLKKVEGEQLEFVTVEKWIQDFLTSKSWEIAFQQYLQLLAGQAVIDGFTLPQTDSPLVQ